MQKKFSMPAWANATNIYEVNVRQYTPEGNFEAFAQELPRLKDMGVETIWLMPITPISEKMKKGSLGSYYACSDYTAINPEFGSFEDFINLVRIARGMGFRLIIDWVANHTGWDHRWTIEHPDYYKKDQATGDFLMARGMEDIIELDYSNPELRVAMIEAMKFWVEQSGIDGFRCDLASWVELSFWREAREALEKIRPLFWLGEFDELENPDYGDVFDASYPWTWMHRMEDAYKSGNPAPALRDLAQRYSALGDGCSRAWYTSNHDENSWNGTEYEKYGDMAIPLAVFCCTWNGIALVYSGQEIPLRDQRIQFFDKDMIHWTGENSMQHFYKNLFFLRAENPALQSADKSVTTYLIPTAADQDVLVYLRKIKDREVLVMLNLSSKDLVVLIEHEQVSGEYSDLFAGDIKDFSLDNQVSMEAWGYLVLHK